MENLRQEVRLALSAATVILWMALGWLFRFDANSYLLVGIPLLILFQVFLARRPLTQLWLRNSTSFRLPWWGWGVAILFAGYPLYALMHDWRKTGWPVHLWEVAAGVGALPLTFALVQARMGTWKSLLGCFLRAGVFGSVLFEGSSMLKHHGFHTSPQAWRIAGHSFALYLPISFMMEEVFFRGGLDSFIQRPGDRLGWLSAVFLSCLWGWWHLPISGMKTWAGLLVLAVVYPLVHVVFGVWFSFYWRRTGSLLVPATVHAFVDSVRNAVI